MTKALKIVLAGCGNMSEAWLTIAQKIPDIQLVGFVDIVEEAAQNRAKLYGVPGAFAGTDIQTMLTQTSPDIVFDCTPPETHSEITIAALQYGCHVLGEKPMATSMEEARRMVKAAQEAGKLYAVIQNRRYDLNIIALKQFLKTGAIGQITTVNSDFYIGAHFGGFREHMKHVLLLDMAIHTFDAARFLMDGDATSVYCKEWNPVGSWYDYDASAVAMFEMSNSAVYTYCGSWCSEGLHTTWESSWRIVGTKGSVTWDGGRNFAAQVVAETGSFISKHENLKIEPSSASEWGYGHAQIIHEFINCVRNGNSPQTICTDNIKSLAMVFGAIESAEKRQPVPVNV